MHSSIGINLSKSANRMKSSCFLMIAALAGCATGPTVPAVVKVPVPVSCVKAAPVAPETRHEAEILAMDDYAATLTTWTERLLLKAYAAKAEAVIAACK